MKNNKQLALKQLGIVFLAIVALNFLSNFFFKRFDLTQDKRYTLSETTLNIIKTVVIKGAYGTRRQVLFAVVDDVAQLQPALTYRVAGNLILERYRNNADAGARIAGDLLNLW